MRQHNLRRHIQTKHHQSTSGGAPQIADATTEWEVTPFLLHPTLESYGPRGPRKAHVQNLTDDVIFELSTGTQNMSEVNE